MSGKKIKTMEELSQLSGISRPTLSKYFQDPESVRKTTKARVESALEEYDYRRVATAVREATGGIPIGVKMSAQHIEDDIDFALEIGIDYLT